MAGEMTEERRARQSESMKKRWAARKNAGPDPAPNADGRKADPPPKPKAKPKPKRKPTSDGDLEGVLAKLFTFPAVPMKMVVGCDFCATHFATEGPRTAHELVELSKDHPQLRGVLEDMYRAYTSVTWVGIVGGYLARPLAHHLAPNDFLAFAEPVLNVPPRPPKPHAHTTNGGPPPMQPPPDMLDQMRAEYAAMTPEEQQAARDQAATMGVDLDEIMGSDAAADQTGDAGADSAGTAEADPDPLAGL